MKKSRRHFLKLIGITPALPAVGWLPKDAPEPEPAPPPFTPAVTPERSAEEVAREILDAVERAVREAPRRAVPFAATAMAGHSFFDVDDMGFRRDFDWRLPEIVDEDEPGQGRTRG